MESVRCYGRLMLQFLSSPIPGLRQISQHMFESSILPWVRAKVIESAVQAGATHLLLLDSDMTYPGDLAHRLLAHRRPFVACNATTRTPPIRWAASDKDGNPIDSNRLRGLKRGHLCGLAVALIETRVYTSMPAPRFDFTFGEKGWSGEDVYFCRAARESGFEPMIDHDLSREIGHVGKRIWGANDVEVRA